MMSYVNEVVKDNSVTLSRLGQGQFLLILGTCKYAFRTQNVQSTIARPSYSFNFHSSAMSFQVKGVSQKI